MEGWTEKEFEESALPLVRFIRKNLSKDSMIIVTAYGATGYTEIACIQTVKAEIPEEE